MKGSIMIKTFLGECKPYAQLIVIKFIHFQLRFEHLTMELFSSKWNTSMKLRILSNRLTDTHC